MKNSRLHFFYSLSCTRLLGIWDTIFCQTKIPVFFQTKIRHADFCQARILKLFFIYGTEILRSFEPHTIIRNLGYDFFVKQKFRFFSVNAMQIPPPQKEPSLFLEMVKWNTRLNGIWHTIFLSNKFFFKQKFDMQSFVKQKFWNYYFFFGTEILRSFEMHKIKRNLRYDFLSNWNSSFSYLTTCRLLPLSPLKKSRLHFLVQIVAQ